MKFEGFRKNVFIHIAGKEYPFQMPFGPFEESREDIVSALLKCPQDCRVIEDHPAKETKKHEKNN